MLCTTFLVLFLFIICHGYPVYNDDELEKIADSLTTKPPKIDLPILFRDYTYYTLSDRAFSVFASMTRESSTPATSNITSSSNLTLASNGSTANLTTSSSDTLKSSDCNTTNLKLTDLSPSSLSPDLLDFKMSDKGNLNVTDNGQLQPSIQGVTI